MENSRVASPGSPAPGSAATLARACARAALTGRTVARLEETAALVRAEGGMTLLAHADVTDPAVAFCEPHVLVNYAGWNEITRQWKELTPETAQTLIAGNDARAGDARGAAADAGAAGRADHPHRLDLGYYDLPAVGNRSIRR
jgi:hypothetical protein